MERPNYYAIIPAEVRYSELKPSAKLLYGELTALSNKYGYCFATNNYFAQLYGVTKNTISLWISDLQKAGFINVKVERNKNKQVVKRMIGITKNSDTTITKNREDNITRVNTKVYKDNISIRELKFKNDISLLEYDVTVKKEFADYWTEQNPSKTKMRFEMEKTFDIKRRLKRWVDNSTKWNKSTTTKSKTKANLNTWKNARNMLDNLNS